MNRHELTQFIAYRLYQQRAGAPGSAVDDWLLAEELIVLCESVLFAVAPVAVEREEETAPAQPEAAPRVAQPQGVAAKKAKKSDPAATLRLLVSACESLGRKNVAKQLGYASASSVGRILQGKRRLTGELIQRIHENLDKVA